MSSSDDAELNEMRKSLERWSDQGALRNQIEDITFTVSDPKVQYTDHRVLVNHLRHECTEYEHVLDHIPHKLNWDDAPLVIKEKALIAIMLKYPHLSEECRRQIEQAREKNVRRQLRRYEE